MVLNLILKNYSSGLADAKGVFNGEVDIGIATEFIVAEEALDNASIYALGTNCKIFKFAF